MCNETKLRKLFMGNTYQTREFKIKKNQNRKLRR